MHGKTVHRNITCGIAREGRAPGKSREVKGRHGSAGRGGAAQYPAGHGEAGAKQEQWPAAFPGSVRGRIHA